MNVEVLIFVLIGVALSDDGCTYINQNTNLVSVDNVAKATTNGFTQEVPVSVGASISISCKDPDNTAFEYGEQTVYKCEVASTTKVNLPLCVSKCTTIADLVDPHKISVFKVDGKEVTGKKLAKSTPVTIECSDASYAQMFKQVTTQNCELWNADALCKKMCSIKGYSAGYTDLSSTGIMPSLADPKYLQVGYSVSISCKSGDYAQPDGALVTHKCDSEDKDINIENCNKMCRVPTAPKDTEYQATHDQLRQGQAFTVKCTGDLKFPIDQKETEVTCQSDGSFPNPYPTCLATCKISAIDTTTTKLSKNIVGGLAQKESVTVSCVDANFRLPYGYNTPMTITCGPTNLDIEVPACQRTCAVPSVPDLNGALSRPVGVRMSLREPITATCNKYYSFEVDSGISKTKNFTCSDADGTAKVNVDQKCYVYAELTHNGAGTLKLKLTGEINDGKDYSFSDTVVDFGITGASTDIKKPSNKPNVAVDVEVGTYEPLKVEVKTTSVVEGKNRVITINEKDIYPGPPSPPAMQENSTSSTAFVYFVHPANDALNTVIRDHSATYTIEYTNNGKKELITVAKDKREDKVKLSNLSPASNYDIQTTITVPNQYGGKGDPTSSFVCTGPNPVNETTLSVDMKEDIVTVQWGAVDQADSYEIELLEDGTSKGTQLPETPNIEYKFKAGSTYDLKIKAIREVDINNNGKPVQFYGDVLEKKISGPPAPPKKDQFKVAHSGSSMTVTRVTSTDEVSTRTNMVQNESLEYVVFLSHDGVTDQGVLKAGVNEWTKEDLKVSTDYDVRIAQAVEGGSGYGMKAFIKSIKTADCGSMTCVSCQDTTQFAEVMFGETVTVKCLEDTFIEIKDPKTGDKKQVPETILLCNKLNQYVYQDDKNQIVSAIECLKKEEVVDPPAEKSNMWYYVIGGVGVFLVLLLVIIIVLIRRKRTQGSYNAKKAKETSKNGVASPDMSMEPKTFVNDDAFFENKWDNDLLRAQSGRSKATSYGSQELRMTIADSDSGITEDLENTYFNPALYSTHCEDDTISTKSALV